MMFPLLLRPDSAWPSSALIIGLGAGSLVKFLYRNRPATVITAVEVRSDVVDAAAHFFRLPEDPRRLAIELADGAAFVAERGPRYDLVLVDGYDARGRVGALDTPEFYRRCRARMRGDAILATNLLTRHRGVDASVERLRAAFGDRAMALPPSTSGNVIALAVRGAPVEMQASVLAVRAKALREETGLNLASTLGRLARAPRAVPDLW